MLNHLKSVWFMLWSTSIRHCVPFPRIHFKLFREYVGAQSNLTVICVRFDYARHNRIFRWVCLHSSHTMRLIHNHKLLKHYCDVNYCVENINREKLLKIRVNIIFLTLNEMRMNLAMPLPAAHRINIKKLIQICKFRINSHFQNQHTI